MNEEFLKKLLAYTVLYVEDEDGIRSNIEEILKHFFKEVYSTNSAKKAYDLYLEKRPDLIITDIQMQEATGIDLIKKIRLTDSKTRVIITSAHTDLNYLLSATELYLVKYIVKPITNDNLTVALKNFVKSYDENKIYNLGDNWIFDCTKSLVSNLNEEFILTKKELDFMKLLLSKNRVITYIELENILMDDNLPITSNAIRLFIKNLRKKLPVNYIKNMQGVGYYKNI